MNKVEVMCPFCLHIQDEQFKEKTTVRCYSCDRPLDVWEDGTVDVSPLYFVRGEVWSDPRAFTMGKDVLRNVDVDVKDFLRKKGHRI